MRKFNVTGLCVPEMHYMVDISGKIRQIRDLIDDFSYFTINRARQYGKTTILAALERALKDDFIVASITFETSGDSCFSSEEAFCAMFVKTVKRALEFSSADDKYIEKWDNCNIRTFDNLSEHITMMCLDRPVILMIDEVDKTSNNRVFLQFLSMLRSKYLLHGAGKDHTFQSVILAGVYDIKNIKLKMIQEGAYTPGESENKLYNSPWNIAVDFEVDMSFCPTEIASMLEVYESDQHTGMDVAAISNDIYIFTSGYPYLVSRICQHIHNKLKKEWTAAGVQNAVQIMIRENNTLFDDIFKNLQNDVELNEMMYDLLIMGGSKSYTAQDPVVGAGLRYGIIKHDKNTDRFVIANKIFEILISNYFISIDSRRNNRVSGVLQYDMLVNGKFDMELCLRKFAEHYAEIYSNNDMSFLERHGRLLFLSYLKPLINGQGFYHIESQFTDMRRMDIVVDFGRQQFIIELRVWRGEQYQHDAYEQLCAYLESKNAHEGYLLTFDFRKERNKACTEQWLDIGGKRIFEVVV